MKNDSKLSFEQKLYIRKNKAKTVFVTKLSGIALVFCIVILYFFAPVSQVSNYDLKGNIYFTNSDVLEIAHINKKTSLYKIDTKEIKELLDEHPLIENSKVTCNFFGLKIEINEIAPICLNDSKYYLTNGTEITKTMLENELYGSFLYKNLEKTYRADFNPNKISTAQFNHFNQIWINATEEVKTKIAFFGTEEQYWDCAYFYSGDASYYYRIKFFDGFDGEISTFTELFRADVIQSCFDTIKNQNSKFEIRSFDDETELHSKKFFSLKVKYNAKDQMYSFEPDNFTTEEK